MQRPTVTDTDVEAIADGFLEVLASADVSDDVAIVAAIRIINELANGDEETLDYAARLLN